MSFFVYPDLRKRKNRLTLYGLVLLEVVAISFIIPSSSSTGEVPPNACAITFCGQIKYITSVSGNNSGLGVVTTSVYSALANQSMVVVGAVGASTIVHTMISNITDSLGDTFTRSVIQQFAPGSLDGNNIEIWFGQTRVSGFNSITAKWNFTDGLGTQILQANIYNGVSGTGAINSTSTLGAASSLTLKTAKSGSWIFGAVNFVLPLCPPPVIGTSPSFIRRIDTCQGLNAVSVNEAESSDNATSLRNTFKLTYSPTGTSTQNDYAVVELVANDAEPLNPDFANLCTVTPTNCPLHLNSVSLNSNPNALGKALALNTAYCTGINTKPLTTTTGTIFLWSAYSADDLNTTSAKIFIQLYVSTNVPSNTFGVGLCATGGNIVATGTIQFPLTGALSLTNTFSTALNGVDTISGTAPAANTYYGWMEVTAQGFVSGSLGMDQLCSNVSFGLCSLQMQEMK